MLNYDEKNKNYLDKLQNFYVQYFSHIFFSFKEM